MDIKFIPAITISKISENKRPKSHDKKLNLRLKGKIVHARKGRKNEKIETVLTLLLDKNPNELKSLINKEVIIFIE